MNSTISVIVPVYNVQEYLPSCIESILAQSYTALEILLVDDGSTDCSGAICDEYAQKDRRITVIHQSNAGAAAAKNSGLQMATGSYLAFADSDDIVELGAYEKLVAALERTGADVVQGSFLNLYTDGAKEMRQTFVEETNEQFLLRFTKEWTCGLLWDKLYRRELFDGISFREGNIIDDEFFTYRGIMNAKKVVRIPDIVYQYRQRKSGVMASDASKERIVLDKLHYLQERRIVVAKRFPHLAASYEEHFLNMLLILSQDPYASEQSITETKMMLKQYFKDSPKYQPSLTFRMKLIFLEHATNKKLLSKRDKIEDANQLERYFE